MRRLPRTGRVMVLAACAVAATGATASCAAAADPYADADPLPDGITVAVLQNRSDVALRRLEIAVSNQTEQVLTVRGATFESAQFVEPAVWEKDETGIAAGRVVNIPVMLGEPDCGGEDPANTVRLDLQLGDADPITVVTEPEDVLERLPALRSEDCLAVAVERIADVTVGDLPRLGAVGTTPVIEVDVVIRPTGAAGSAVIDEALGTTLFAPVDPDTGAAVPTTSIGTAIDGTGQDAQITVAFTANRCDPHAVAEDKRGTIFPLRVTTADGTSGIYSLPASREAKATLIDYLSALCASG